MERRSEKEGENKNLLRLQFWSDRIVQFTAMSLKVVSDHQTDERRRVDLKKKFEGKNVNLPRLKFPFKILIG